MLKTISIGFLALVGFLALGWIFMGNSFFLYKFFAPKQAAVQREVFENTRSFTQGMIQELENMQFEYEKATDTKVRASLRSIILHRVSGFNLNDQAVSVELKAFISQLKSEY